MAPSAHYVWSPIRKGDGKLVPVGSKVDAKTLGVDDTEFESLVESGAVRTAKYPVPKELADSKAPAEHMREQAAKLSAGQSLEEESSAE